jgi:hypothetical protein
MTPRKHAYQRKWRTANPVKVAAYQAKSYDANREKRKMDAKRNHFKRLYGLSLEDRDKMLASQGNLCLCCGSNKPGSTKGWQVHHLHQTNRVVGILCHRCNVASGWFKDDPVLLLRMALLNLPQKGTPHVSRTG